MKSALAAAALAAALFAQSWAALAGERTVTLAVEMSCPACPYIVAGTLERVDGVLAVAVSYERQQAVVDFDDDHTTVAALVEATAEVGFPSTPTGTN